MAVGGITMKYYTFHNEVYAFDDDQLDYVKPEMVEMTAEEIEAHINPKPTIEQLAQQARNKRDQLLLDSQWLIQRHRDQLETGITTTLTTDQYTALLNYRQSLRDVPEQQGFPITINWPVFQL
ncbi:hypothetical protein C9426_00905 [Serratia sp. S1B]|nr:hypothetical protein C9426_00905 [Serratia sp. S1B]